jgi:L-alanine-DL-glutamate epimerase-like enolase superfamily enzyme
VNPATPRRLTLRIETECWPLKAPFHITGYTVHAVDAIVVTLDDGVHQGRGEASGVYYHGDDPARMAAAVEAVRPQIEAGLDRAALARLLPPGGARNAVDCALWDLEAKQLGRPAWALAGLAAPKPLLTAYTLGADSPQAMAEGAKAYAQARLVKLKLTGEPDDAERVRRVRAARPDVRLSVDANQGFTRASLAALTPTLLEAGVDLIEQPFPLDRDEWLDDLGSPIPIAADESVQASGDLTAQLGRVQMINIKLDKCGGLTEGLAMARRARLLGFKVMVGNMTGTTLAMAPAALLGQLCDLVDLDGPLPLVEDRAPAAVYRDGAIWCPPEAWGGPAAKAA